MIVNDREGGVGAEGDLPNDHFVEHDGEGVHIGAIIEVFRANCLLWRDILGRTHNHIGGEGRFARLRDARQAKIGEINSAIFLRDDDVRGLHITMQNTLFVSIG